MGWVRRPWLAACAVAAAGALLGHGLGPPGDGGAATAVSWFDWQPQWLATQPWRLLTAGWVHLGAAHLTLNLGALALLAWLGHEADAGWRVVRAWALAWPLTHLLLWLLLGAQLCLTGGAAVAVPALAVEAGATGRVAFGAGGAGLLADGLCGRPWPLHHYGGLSGVLHAGVAVLAVALWRAPDAARRRVGRVLAAGLLVKLLAEQPWGPVLSWDAGLGMARVPLAHLAGALAGLACGAALALGPVAASPDARRPDASRPDAPRPEG
ncbi:MAG: hypothetical protein RLY78_4066 [Pseudomonadota bacterium]